MTGGRMSDGMGNVKLIPLEVLLGQPERGAAQISPDGTRLSYIAPLDGVLNVFVGDAGSGIERPVTHDTDRGIQGYFWAHDNRHLMYIRDKDGSEKTYEFLRVGRITLLYQSPDGMETGVWNKQTRQWDALPQEYRSAVEQGLRIAKKQAPPALIKMPVQTAEKAS